MAMHPSTDSESTQALLRIALAWLVYFLGSITLQHIGVLMAIIFTFLQIIVLLRDKFGLFKSIGVKE